MIACTQCGSTELVHWCPRNERPPMPCPHCAEVKEVIEKVSDKLKEIIQMDVARQHDVVLFSPVSLADEALTLIQEWKGKE